MLLRIVTAQIPSFLSTVVSQVGQLFRDPMRMEFIIAGIPTVFARLWWARIRQMDFDLPLSSLESVARSVLHVEDVSVTPTPP